MNGEHIAKMYLTGSLLHLPATAQQFPGYIGLHYIVATWARVVCLIYTPEARLSHALD